MINRIKKWLRDQNNITRKTAGLAEKEASTMLKLKVAMDILERRKQNLPVLYERRRENSFEYALKNGH